MNGAHSNYSDEDKFLILKLRRELQRILGTTEALKRDVNVA